MGWIMLFIYLAIGIVIASALYEEGDDTIVLVVIGWPVILLILLGFGIIRFLYDCGRFIRGVFILLGKLYISIREKIYENQERFCNK